MKKYNHFFLICGLVMAGSEVWKQLCLTFIVNGGQYDWWHFPFQLCSIPMYVCLLLPWVKSPRIRQIFLTFLMDFGLLGGIFTFFDTSGLYYPYSPLTVHSFAWHVLLIVLGIAAGLSGYSDYSLKGYGRGVLFYGISCLAATIFNMLFYPYGAINMFYISPHYKMTQIVFADIAAYLGNTAGIFVYVLCIILGAGMFHIVWCCIARRLKFVTGS